MTAGVTGLDVFVFVLLAIVVGLGLSGMLVLVGQAAALDRIERKVDRLQVKHLVQFHRFYVGELTTLGDFGKIAQWLLGQGDD